MVKIDIVQCVKCRNLFPITITRHAKMNVLCGKCKSDDAICKIIGVVDIPDEDIIKIYLSGQNT